MDNTQRAIYISKPQLAAIYDGAIDHIQKYGWQQCSLGKEGHPCCVIGALCIATFNILDLKTPEPLGPLGVMGPLHRALDKESGVIAHWNDTPGRTKEEVLDALTKARGLIE
jgi:hypothetical protein